MEPSAPMRQPLACVSSGHNTAYQAGAAEEAPLSKGILARALSGNYGDHFSRPLSTRTRLSYTPLPQRRG